jgi:hypothetical protein
VETYSPYRSSQLESRELKIHTTAMVSGTAITRRNAELMNRKIVEQSGIYLICQEDG